MKYTFVVYELAVREASAEWVCVRPLDTRPAVGKIVTGLGFRVQGLGFRVQGLGFRVQGLGFRV